MEIHFSFKFGTPKLYRIRLRSKIDGTSRTVFRMGQYTFDVDAAAHKEFGDIFYINHPVLLSPQQVVNAAKKYLPKL